MAELIVMEFKDMLPIAASDEILSSKDFVSRGEAGKLQKVKELIG